MSKVSLAGNASGTGIFTIASPNSNTDRTLTLPDQTGTLLSSSAQGIPKSALPTGSVLQVVSVSDSSSVSTSSSSDQATGLVATITPTSSTSKVLIFVTPYLRAVGGQCFVYAKLWRGAITSGTLLVDGYPIVGSQSNSDFRGVGSMQYLDSPATTSATTYRVSINSSFANSVNINSSTNPSAITLMEIAA
jgi:hypothetical protein